MAGIALTLINTVITGHILYMITVASIHISREASGTENSVSGPVTVQEPRMIWLDELPAEMVEMARQNTETYLEQVLRENPNAVRTSSGLIYEILQPGNSIRIKNEEDVFIMEWEMLTRSGTRTPSLDNPDRVKLHRGMTLESMMPGMAEGIRLIGEGGKILLYIPQHLIYKPEQSGFSQVQNEIIFIVELIRIDPPEKK